MLIVDHFIYKNLPILPLHSASIDDVVTMEDYITPHATCVTVLFVSSVLVD
nr:MAG TPA: hypothetical protein [Caudoviricetes sp.]